MFNNYMPISNYLAGEVGSIAGKADNAAISRGGISLLADDGSGGNCTTNCQTACTGGCSGSCSGTCSGTCSGGCKGSCKAACADNCSGGCSGHCSGTCSNTCSNNCSGTCSGGCETYCAGGLCQSYCQYQQTYSKNHGRNNPGGEIFTWSTDISQGATINIKASDWNTLASYIEDAAPYCSKKSITLSRVKTDDPITAAIFNNIGSGLATIGQSVQNKTKDVDLIKASEISALATKYNAALIDSSLPSKQGEYSGRCCQLGEACMTQASGRPSLQPCTQTPRCNKVQ